MSSDRQIAQAAIAFGGVGPTVLRARRTEQFLDGQPLTEETMHAAGDLAADEITPITDVRGAADYRRQLTRNVLPEVLPPIPSRPRARLKIEWTG